MPAVFPNDNEWSFARYTMEKPEIVENNVVVSLEYKLTVDGEVVDSSEETGPIEFIQGSGEIIPGLERGIQGMRVDENRNVVVSASDGYGEYDPSGIVSVPREQFPEDMTLEPGVQLVVKDQEGNTLDASVAEIQEQSVLLDFNHPLAGKDLSFDVTVLDLRSPTDEEIAHGHVHGSDHGHEHDYEED
jgi:FKBP-type peptidyl-prolyl cis-trans isomerase SlyD